MIENINKSKLFIFDLIRISIQLNYIIDKKGLNNIIN